MKKYLNYLFAGLRLVVGWHFLYEGLTKVFAPAWTAKHYLLGSRWIFAGLFEQIARSDSVMNAVDLLNMWGLVLIGLSLLTGLMVRWSSIAGAIMLLFYFVAYPPIPGYTFGSVNEGSYLWVNKTLIEFMIFIVIACLPKEMHFGIDRWIKRWKEEKARAPIPNEKGETSGKSFNRREILRDLIGLPAIGVFAYALYKKRKWDSFEEKYIQDKKNDAISCATVKNYSFASLDELQAPVPKGKIGNMELSRLVMGGNLIGGWAHSRDLIYVSKLVKAYHNDEKVMQTLELGEKCGINALLTNPQLARIIQKYKRETKSKLKIISDCGYKLDFVEGVRRSLAFDADAMYCQGEISDRMVMAGKFNDFIEGIKMIRAAGKPAGIGAHRIETIKAIVDKGIQPDFWVKTIHNHNYWSAQPEAEWKDNMFCYKPQETIDYMNSLEEPWIAFKVLAAGAIHPKEGFQYAFDNGADFLCVGMYDFQIVENCNILLGALDNVNRIRPWRG